MKKNGKYCISKEVLKHDKEDLKKMEADFQYEYSNAFIPFLDPLRSISEEFGHDYYMDAELLREEKLDADYIEKRELENED